MCKHTLPKVLCTHIINNMQIGFWVTLHNSSAYFSGSCGTFYILLLRAYLWYVDCSCMYILLLRAYLWYVDCSCMYILLLRAYLWYVDCSCMYILFSEPTCSSLASMEAERDRASCKDKGNGSNDNINNDIISHQHLPNIPMGCSWFLGDSVGMTILPVQSLTDQRSNASSKVTQSCVESLPQVHLAT